MDEKWLAILTYLTDIFEKLNDFNLSLQSHNTNILILSDKVKPFTTKIALWKNEHVSQNYEMFPCFDQFIDENEVDLVSQNYKMFPRFNQFVDENEVDLGQVKDTVMMHCMNLQFNFLTQFPEFPENGLCWIRDPVSSNTNKMGSKQVLKEKEQRIYLSTDENVCSTTKT
jgi:hypothetical protein